MARRFPVTRLSCSIPEKGVHIAKRGAGTKIAWCNMDIQNGSLSGLDIVENALQEQIEKAEKMRTRVEEGLKLVSHVASRVMESTVTIEFLMNHDVLMDLSNGTSIRCDIDVADEIGQENGVSALYALGLIYGFSAICGNDEGAL